VALRSARCVVRVVGGRMRRVMSIALVGMFAVVALATPAAATATGSTVMSTARVKAAGISVKYPSAWIALPLTKERFAAVMKIIARKNPELAAEVSFMDPSQWKFFAIDPATYSSMQVVFVRGVGGPANLGDVKQAAKQASETAGAKFLDAEAVKVSGKTAFRAHLSHTVKGPDGTPVEVRQGQLYLTHGDDLTVVAVAMKGDVDPRIIDTILSSVHRV